MNLKILSDERYYPRRTGIRKVIDAKDPDDPKSGLALLWRGREVASVWVKKLSGDMVYSFYGGTDER